MTNTTTSRATVAPSEVGDVVARVVSSLALAAALTLVAIVWPVAEATRFVLERSFCRER